MDYSGFAVVIGVSLSVAWWWGRKVLGHIQALEKRQVALSDQLQEIAKTSRAIEHHTQKLVELVAAANSREVTDRHLAELQQMLRAASATPHS